MEHVMWLVIGYLVGIITVISNCAVYSWWESKTKARSEPRQDSPEIPIVPQNGRRRPETGVESTRKQRVVYMTAGHEQAIAELMASQAEPEPQGESDGLD